MTCARGEGLGLEPKRLNYHPLLLTPPPLFYHQVKAKGKNQKDLEEAMKTGEISGVEEQDFSVDPYEPHPDFRFTKGQVVIVMMMTND